MSKKKKKSGVPGINFSIVKRLLAYLGRGHLIRFGIVLICIFIASCANVASSLFLGTLIDDYITPLISTTVPVFDGLLRAILAMAVIYVCGILATFIYNRLMVSISQGVLRSIREEMFSKMQSFPIKYFDTHAHGDIMSCYTNDVDTLRQMLSQSIPQMFSSAISIVVVFFSMLATNIPLTILVVLCVFVMINVSAKIAGNSSKYFVRQQISLGKVNGYIEEMVEGQKVIKVFCHEEEAKREFDILNNNLFYNANEANKFANILMPILQNIGNLQYVFIAIIGGALAVAFPNIGITLGVIASFLQLSKSFTQPISQISQQLNSVIMALAGAERIFELMDEKPEEDKGTVTLVNVEMKNGKFTESEKRTNHWAWKVAEKDGSFRYVPLTGDIKLEHVDFSYVPEKPILKDITLEAKAGQKVAFVGATGAGKTTITNLINRFYDISDGSILYDGIDVSSMKKADLRRSLGIVLQDTNLFTGTVGDNIRYGKLDATNDEVIAAAKLANAHDFISRLPDGYNTMLTSNGSNLSQGQRQLIAIARAAVADPPVMILDEATSSIDTRTESLVQAGMDSLMKGRTVFVIAHRLSTVRNSDAIMVLDHGRIIERGSHDELIAQKGNYYQLYTGAFELE